MSSIEVIELKISSILKYLKLLKKNSGYTAKEFENDPILKGGMERYLYLAVQTTIELAEAIIAFKNLRRPSMYREAFEILKEENIIKSSLTEKLIKMTGFRNAISHDYESFDSQKLHSVLKNNLKDIEDFLKAIKEKLKL